MNDDPNESVAAAMTEGPICIGERLTCISALRALRAPLAGAVQLSTSPSAYNYAKCLSLRLSELAAFSSSLRTFISKSRRRPSSVTPLSALVIPNFLPST